MSDKKPCVAALAALLQDIEVARQQVEERQEAEREANRNTTSARNHLNDLQKHFDKVLGEFKKESRVFDSHWANQERASKSITNIDR